MAVQYILGRAGTGKSTAILDRIVALTNADPLGPAIFLILPKQATFQAQRELVVRLGGFSRIHVLSFDLLGEEILNSCGDVGLPEVTPLGRRLVLGHLLRLHRDRLKFFTKSAATPGLTAELDATFAEFDRSGVDVSGLDKMLETFEGDDRTDPALHDKLLDVRLLMDAYNTFIGSDKIDPAQRMKRVLDNVSKCSLFKDAHVFIDEFFDFTGYEQRLLIAVAGAAKETVVALMADSEPPAQLDDLSIFHRTERTKRSLTRALKDVPMRPPVILPEPVRFKSAALSEIERGLFVRDGIAPPGSPGLERFEAADVTSEVDAVARRIKSAVAGGMRYRQIGVLVRGLDAYQTEIAASFAEHGIPMFADVRRPATHHPLLLAARACVQIATRDWPHDAVMTLVKSGLAGLTDDEADALENYVLQHRVRGRRWESIDPWIVLEITPSDESEKAPLTAVTGVDESRTQIVTAVRPLIRAGRGGQTAKVRALAEGLFDVLRSLRVPESLAGWIAAARKAGDLERAAEHEQVWAEFVLFFTQVVDLLGDTEMSLADFSAVIDAGMEGFDLALTPQTVDQVLVGQVDRTRTPPLDLVFVLGLNEGIFPRPAEDRTLLSDRDRRLLRERAMELDPESDRQLLDERFLAYLAFTRASQTLVVSRPTAGESGRVAAPSLFWTELQRLVPDVVTAAIPTASLTHPHQVSTPRQLLTGLMRWVRSGADPKDKVWPAVYQWLAESVSDETRSTGVSPVLGSQGTGETPVLRSSDARSEVLRLARAAWPALVYHNDAALSAESAAGLFPVPLRASVAQLETWAACPFKHFVRYGLRLGRREDPDVTTVDLSNAYHSILDGVVADLCGKPDSWKKATTAAAKPVVRNHVAAVGQNLRGDLLHGTARNRYLLGRIERSSNRAVAGLLKAASLGTLRPDAMSIQFGHGKDHPAYVVTTPAGDVVELSGRIDRVDRCGDGTEVVLIDYRLKVDAVRLDKMYHGLRLQLFAAALVVNRDSVRNRAVGLLDWPIEIRLQPVDHPGDAVLPDDPNFLIRDRPRGVIDAGSIGAFHAEFDGGASPVVSIKINKTGELGDRDRTDAVTAEELGSLLVFVEQKLGEIAGGITGGEIAVKPYMIGDETPCPRCEYRSVCRFEPAINRYHHLERMKRTEVLQKVTGAGGEE